MNLSNISNLSHLSNVSKDIAGKANDLSLLNISGFRHKVTNQEEEEKELCNNFKKAEIHREEQKWAKEAQGETV
jgi:hypothetical protein